MSFAPFLSSIAETLMSRVYPTVTDPRSRDALETCVRAIAGMASALDIPPDDRALDLPLPNSIAAPTERLLITTPPENIAANHQTAARIAAGAQWLSNGEWLRDPEATWAAREMLAWEREVLAAKITAMDRCQSGTTTGQTDVGDLEIDRSALERYFQQRCGAASGARITDFRQTTGGRSRQTAVFTLAGDTGLPRELVVQRDHPAGITSFGAEGQYPVLKLLADTKLKTPKPILLELDPDVIGAPFLILEKAPGTVAGPDYFAPPQSPALAMELAQQLAILHSADPTPLAGIIRSTVEQGTTEEWTKELGEIEAAWHRLSHAPSLAISAAFVWMRAHVDQIGNERAIVHNDAAFHNVLVENGRFSSLLDWELVHIGHPAEDLGYCRAFVQEIADWDEFLAAYVDAGGIPFPAAVIDYFSLRAGIHLMTLLQYGCSRLINGATSDINLAEVGTSFIPRHHHRIANMVSTIVGKASVTRRDNK